MYANDEGVCRVSIQKMADEIGTQKRQVHYYLAELGSLYYIFTETLEPARHGGWKVPRRWIQYPPRGYGRDAREPHSVATTEAEPTNPSQYDGATDQNGKPTVPDFQSDVNGKDACVRCGRRSCTGGARRTAIGLHPTLQRPCTGVMHSDCRESNLSDSSPEQIKPSISSRLDSGVADQSRGGDSVSENGHSERPCDIDQRPLNGGVPTARLRKVVKSICRTGLDDDPHMVDYQIAARIALRSSLGEAWQFLIALEAPDVEDLRSRHRSHGLSDEDLYRRFEEWRRR